MVVLDERGLQLGDGRGDGRGNVPAVARQLQVRPAHREAKLQQAPAVDRLARNDRDAQRVLEARHAQVAPAGRREVHHVQRENDGPAQIQHLMDEIEVPLEIGGVDDADDAVGLRDVGAAAKEHVAHDGFVR